MITAIILSSFLVKKRYYIESTNFLHIWSVLFPVQSLIYKIFVFIFNTVKFVFYHIIVIFVERTHIVYILCPFRIFKAGIFNYLYTVKIRMLFSNTKGINRHTFFFQKINLYLNFFSHSILYTILVIYIYIYIYIN